MKVIATVALLVGAVVAQPAVPRFEDYPVAPAWTGSAAPIRFTSPSERMFRTQILNAAKLPPNFAGHYRFAGWGCGSLCVAGAIIDLQNGSIFPPPLGGKGIGWGRWMFCGGVVEGHYTEYRLDSNLMIVRCQDAHGIGEHYLAWENNAFREILLVHNKPR